MRPVLGLTSVISKIHLLQSPAPSFVVVLNLFHIPAIKILHGFQCGVAVEYEVEEQTNLRTLNLDQKLVSYPSHSPCSFNQQDW